jgi:hypothetical protein
MVMAKLVGSITWEAQPGYPTLEGELNNERIVAKYTAPPSNIKKYLPDYGSGFKDSRFPYLSDFGHLRLSDYSVIPRSGSKLVEVTLTYTSPDGSFARDDQDDEVTYNTDEEPLPLEKHSGYRMNWNHDLHAKVSVNESPVWWESAAAGHVPPGDDPDYKWVSPGEQPASEWKKLIAATKPGVENYLRGRTTVHWKKYSRFRKTLQRIADQDYTKQSPPDTFGRSGEWLQGGSSIRKEGRLWVLEVTYINAPTGWDNDLYG